MDAAGPSPVQAAEELAGRLPPRRLADLTATLSRAYREGGALPRFEPDEVAAYCGYRFPATHAAVRAALLALVESCPGLSPERMVDLGGGPGAAAFAAGGVFPSLRAVTVLDSNEHMLRAGSEIASLTPGVLPPATSWVRAALDGPLPDLPPADLVVASYLLGELAPLRRDRLVAAIAAPPASSVLLVEPGTPAGHRRILGARAALVQAGWTVAAPCPHDGTCPMGETDWCHFSVRIARSRLHRQAKGADLGYEDEKFSYVAAVREPCRRPPARIVRHPEWRRSVVVLRLCTAPEVLESRTVPRSAGAAYRAARRARWGDAWPAPAAPSEPSPPPSR